MRFRVTQRKGLTAVIVTDDTEREFLVRKVLRAMEPPAKVEVEATPPVVGWRRIYPRWWDKTVGMWRGFDRSDLSP